MNENLRNALRKLRLSGLAQSLEVRLQEAAGHNLNHAEFLELILQDELAIRAERLIQRRVKAAAFREVKSIDQFDFSFNPSIKRPQIFDLATCRFIEEKVAVFIVGPCGTGKSHIAKTVAHGAIEAGYKVMYREAHTFFEDLFEASELKRKKKVNKLFAEADLLVIDDLFLRKKMPDQAADDLLDIILTRYSARRSTVITSNRPLEDWGKLLRDNAASSAIVDRLLHRGHLLQFEGRSYRLKEASIRLAANKRKRSG